MNEISLLEYTNESLTQNEDEMARNTIDYFLTLFTSQNVNVNMDHILSGVECCISTEDNRLLSQPFCEEEIYLALKDIKPLKALRLDGFPTIFFQKCWHIIGKEISLFYLNILNNNSSFDRINTTNIVLIPRILNPTSMTNFRAISLCTVLYKLIAKTVANRLRNVIDACIDKAQSAFVPGRLISDNVLLNYVILHTLGRKRVRQKGSMALKLDMSKAYNQVEWRFLRVMMDCMGFHKEWVNFIMKCILTVSYSVCINGQAVAPFRPGQGLR